MIAALFDCDGTLYSGQFGPGLLQYARAHGRQLAALRYYADMAPRLLAGKLHLIGDEAWRRPLVSDLAWLLQDWDAPRVAAAFEWLANENLLPTLRPDTLARLRHHQAEGHAIALVSAMFTPCLEIIARHLGVADFAGTRIEVVADRFTGRIVPPVLTGTDKDRAARAVFAARGLEIDWPASYAYADSFTDQGLFDMVGHPIAVYPDAKLLALAKARGWEIIGEA